MKPRPYNIDGFRLAARRRLPRAVFDFVDGGATDEWTMHENCRAFERYAFMPTALRDVHDCRLATTICGQPVEAPLMLAPAGLVGMVHRDGERGQVLAAAQHGVVAVASSASTYSIEELAAAAPDALPWFQLYPYKDRAFYGSIVDRVRAAGFRGLCVTVDAPVAGKRERDLSNNLTVKPLRITSSNVLDAVRHPRWLAHVLRERRIIAKLSTERAGGRPTLRSLLGSAGASAANLVEMLPRGATWSDFEWLRSRWPGPLAIKGLINPADARRAADLGADAVIVSNHGGRQLDGLPSTLSALPAVVDAVGGAVDVILDGGIRRGADVVKALCLGASACMVGRPWVFGLAAYGTDGVGEVISVLKSEIATTMALLGERDITRLDTHYLVACSRKPESTFGGSARADRFD